MDDYKSFILRHMRTLLILFLLGIPVFSQAQSTRSHRTHKREKKPDYRHILTVTPISGIIAYADVNPAAGIDYEYLVDKKRIVGLHIPVMFGYSGPDDGINSYRRTVFYVAPGIRFHADAGHGRVDFSTGPSIMFGNAHYRYQNNYYNPYQADADYNYSISGIVVDNAINIHERAFIFGFDVRTGYTFEKHNDSRYFLEFGMHFGGRFL